MHREALDLLMAEVNKALHGKSCKFFCVLLKEHTVNVCRFWYEDEGLQHLCIQKDINQETDQKMLRQMVLGKKRELETELGVLSLTPISLHSAGHTYISQRR